MTERDKESVRTLAELVCHLPVADARAELEAFRVTYEKLHGLTDMTRVYTCMWPAEKQAWLLDHHPRHFFAGLPEFVQAFVRAKIRSAADRGQLDDLPEVLLSLFSRGHTTDRVHGR